MGKELLFILSSQNTTECLVDIEVSLILIMVVGIKMQLHLSFQLQTRRNLSKLQILRMRYIVVLVMLQHLVGATILVLNIMLIKTKIVIQI